MKPNLHGHYSSEHYYTTCPTGGFEQCCTLIHRALIGYFVPLTVVESVQPISVSPCSLTTYYPCTLVSTRRESRKLTASPTLLAQKSHPTKAFPRCLAMLCANFSFVLQTSPSLTSSLLLPHPLVNYVQVILYGRDLVIASYADKPTEVALAPAMVRDAMILVCELR